ncbi:MAG: DUF2249 domain-containing protein, partial [Candidatus Marinimicrobia bacterium]|nr:DUF2249 domain-containing protein [Candidatus Neomarinimicrobiota bacterium]
MVILGKTKIKDALEQYPQLKEVLISYSSKFKKLDNKFIFNTVAKWATFNDVSKIGNISICDLLHTLNEEIGETSELNKSFPDCIKEIKRTVQLKEPDWYKNVKQFIEYDVREIDGYFLPKIFEKLSKLKEGKALIVINSFEPAPLINMLEDKKVKYFSEKINDSEFHLTILFQKSLQLIDPKIDWKEQLDLFPDLNVIGMSTDPFEMIMKKAQNIGEGHGFVLTQNFKPDPLINMLVQMGFETLTEQVDKFRFKNYFYKPID